MSLQMSLHPCFVVGISGGSGSGKSTVCRILAQNLKEYAVKTLAADTFFRRPLPKMISPATGMEMDEYNSPESIDYEGLYQAILDIRKDGQTELLIVEGNGIFYFEKLREVMDLKVFLELEIELRFYRRLTRNMAAGRGSMEEIADFYMNSARFSEQKHLIPTGRYADVLLRGDNYDKGLEVLDLYIRGQLDRH